MDTRITNIVLDRNRFTVFATIIGNEEINTFHEEVTAQDITAWVDERKAYYQMLLDKESSLIEELVNKDI